MAKIFQGLGPKRRDSSNGDRVYASNMFKSNGIYFLRRYYFVPRPSPRSRARASGGRRARGKYVFLLYHYYIIIRVLLLLSLLLLFVAVLLLLLLSLLVVVVVVAMLLGRMAKAHVKGMTCSQTHRVLRLNSQAGSIIIVLLLSLSQLSLLLSL